ncbi:Primosomal replication protein N'' [Actinobacillus pleuropneumoniae]|nr:Primosomal replication protein N'' [Actinobacillus pleuropneumoniae]
MFSDFPQVIQQKLTVFSPFLEQEVIVKGNLFSQNQKKVSDFIQEITHTAQLLSQQTTEDYADFYATKLLRQFDALNHAVFMLEKRIYLLEKYLLRLFHSQKTFTPSPLPVD